MKRAVLVAALAALASNQHALAGKGTEEAREERVSPPERDDVFAEGLRDLRAAEAGLRAHPDSIPMHLDRLRILYVLGVRKKGFLGDAEKEIDWLRERIGADNGDGSDLLLAYRGAITVARAKFGFNPTRKLEHLKAGIPLLDSALEHAPDQPEIRYLRLVSGYYLPFFIGRKEKVAEDFRALARILPQAADRYPPKWFLSVAGFVVDKGDLGQEEKARLEGAMRTVAAGSQSSARGPGEADR
ncbi:MAG: hypothetical protein JWP91_2056 [Fibrobacteres bacterium]|nr:hypothetical protein [Fibrobacterota bacterium]